MEDVMECNLKACHEQNKLPWIDITQSNPKQARLETKHSYKFRLNGEDTTLIYTLSIKGLEKIRAQN